jgi:hypothetical protein
MCFMRNSAVYRFQVTRLSYACLPWHAERQITRYNDLVVL